VVLAVIGICACSTAPKRPLETVIQRQNAGAYLELANREADRGNYEEAWDIAAEARRIAVSIDDPSLIIKTGLSAGTILYAVGKRDEATVFWNEALAEAERIDDRELASVCRIYAARARLLDFAAGREPENLAALRADIKADLARIQEDKLFLAFGWTVAGLVERESRRWAEAESAIKKALAIHEGERYLEQAAYDWYLIASVRSLADQYEGALDALSQALAYDRRAENSYGIGKDWFARGEVCRKARRVTDAEAAYRRAAEIFKASNFEDDAEAARRRLEELK
jgi:tetratricopeptide (TPR) repeat protein